MGKRRAEAGDLRVRPGPPVAEAELPRVSIVILNLDGRTHLEGCFESLAGQRYPRDRWEVLLVDNGSTDGSAALVRSRWPWVRLLENARNVGFSAGCNQGAREAADPGALVFLNNDMRVETDFLRELVAPLVRGECQATTGKMLSWDGKRMNSAGGGMNFHGIGLQRGYEEEPAARFDVPRKTLFACGGAMAIDPEVFRAVGGFDEEFFAYYEDVDLGWRMWVQGHEAHYVPSAVCYHHHSSTSRRLPRETIRLLQVRNPLLACFKNYDRANLERLLPAMLALAIRRMRLVAGDFDEAPFRIERLGPGAAARSNGILRRLLGRRDDSPVDRLAVADLIAINDLVGRWEHWTARRAEVQAARRRQDAEIFRLFLKPHWCIEADQGYRGLHAGLTAFLGLDRLFEGAEEPGPEPKG